MKDEFEIIAHIRTDFPGKFGLPRQSGLAGGLTGKVVFEKKYRVNEAFRGLEGFDYVWLIWKFSETVREDWSPTVRPPRLGGNRRVGVFATRSPFRPNPIGLSCLKLEKIDYDDPEGPVLIVSGIDMTDNTPVYDIKPYLPYVEAKPGARGGFTDDTEKGLKQVNFEVGWNSKLSGDTKELAEKLTEILGLDPRPSYQDDEERIYGFEYAGYEVRFKASGEEITVKEALKK